MKGLESMKRQDEKQTKGELQELHILGQASIGCRHVMTAAGFVGAGKRVGDVISNTLALASSSFHLSLIRKYLRLSATKSGTRGIRSPIDRICSLPSDQLR
jgi:hypothetical protein